VAGEEVGMEKNILVTGVPKSGKSTLLKKIVADIQDKAGFVTNEILGTEGRVGFEIESHTGHKAILAHVDFATPYTVSKYGIDVENLDAIIPGISTFSSSDLLYLDEIGQMQLFSEKFKDLVLKFLNSPNTCVATLSYVYQNSFTELLKDRDDVILVEISPENREKKEEFVRKLIQKIAKARVYLKQPERFTRKENKVVLRSEHGTRTLMPENGCWACNCEFFQEYGICSHVIATNYLCKN